jgi:hypothetical protein
MVVSETWRLDLTVPQPQRHRPDGRLRPLPQACGAPERP